jgi:nucleoside-diphosphate-sugar epimerase
MRIAVTGGTGLVGRFIVEDALRRGQAVTVMGRTPPRAGFFSAPVRFVAYDLTAAPPPLHDHDALVHAAFDHIPGQYRGGEGDDPAGFLARNLTGTLALFAAAKKAGLRQTVFLSTRAVYGDYPEGTPLPETLPPRPDTLYGQVKLAAEQALGADGVSLRATGVYGPAGPGQAHKWADLFDDFAQGRPIAPRIATEVHGDDLARAVQIAFEPDVPPVLNVSDLTLDRHDLLTEVARITGCATPPPPRATSAVSAMDTTRLQALGWVPSGMMGLRAALLQMLEQVSR